MRAIYCTSFCNFGHDVLTGKPVGHECYVLHPEDLCTEAEGTEEEASALASRGMRKRTVDGTWRRNPGDWGNTRAITVKGRASSHDLDLSTALRTGRVISGGARFVKAPQ